MNKIKIAFLSANCYSLFNQAYKTGFGGAEVDQYNLAKYLALNLEFDVTFYVGDFGQTSEPEYFDGVRIQKIKMFGWNNKNTIQRLVFYSQLCKTLWLSKADVILTEMANDMVGWAAIFFKILKKKGFIHRLASDQDTNYINGESSGRYITYYLYQLGLKKADYIFSQTVQQQELLKRNMGFESKIVPNGFFINDNIHFDQKKHILWVGRAVSVKRPQLFIDLAKKIPEKQFIMIMPFIGQEISEDFKCTTLELLDEAHKLPNFKYIDYVPFDEIQEYFNQAQIFVNTSEYEGFPNTFIQACLGGTPIASLSVNPDDFINQNQLGRYCNNHLDLLIDFIKNLKDEEMGMYGKKALAYVKEHHDIQIMGKAYESAIYELIGKDNGLKRKIKNDR